MVLTNAFTIKLLNETPVMEKTNEKRQAEIYQ